jgi:monoamine oxidase
VQLDFKDTDSNGNFRLNHYHENYGYNLESALSKHPIKELDNNSHKEDLMNSLKKGNLQSATFIKDGQEVKQYIEANPQFKTLNVYDANRQRLDVKQGKDQQQSQEKGQNQNQNQNQNQKQSAKQQEKAGDDEGTGEPKQKQQRRKSQSL